jgi:hypothetical protein
MRLTKINFSQPFEKVLVGLLSVPKAGNVVESGLKALNHDPELTGTLHCLYQAAQSRQVETEIGPVKISPPVASALRDTPFYVETQVDFLLEALTRVLRGASSSRGRIPTLRTQETLNNRHPAKLFSA